MMDFLRKLLTRSEREVWSKLAAFLEGETRREIAYAKAFWPDYAPSTTAKRKPLRRRKYHFGR